MSVESVMREQEEHLMGLPNVKGVAPGEKAGQPVIQVFVTHKVPESALRPQEVVPKAIGGYQTDVVEIGDVMAQPR